MPRPAESAPAPLLATPTIGIARGRLVGDPVSHHEFRRTDTIVIRAQAQRTPVISARLLDQRGKPLTALPASPTDSQEFRLPLGSLGPGDYVIELTATAGEETAQQFVAFRVTR